MLFKIHFPFFLVIFICVMFLSHEYFLFRYIYTELSSLNLSLFWIKVHYLIFLYAAICYLSVIFSDPGILTKERLEIIKSQPGYKKELDDHLEINHCYYCRSERPPRTHHDKQYDKCILEYEHFCPFINNTVGKRNYRMFILFMLSAVILSISVIPVFSQIFWFRGAFKAGIILCVFSVIMFLVLDFLLVGMLQTQIELMIVNQTTVELEINKLKKIKSSSKYDTGSLYKNLCCRLGDNPYIWLLPLPNTKLTGIYEINPEYVEEVNKKYDGEEDEQDLTPQQRLQMTLKRLKQNDGKELELK